jgi:hypothetical protein
MCQKLFVGEVIMKIWIDDVRPAPDGYVWIRSVNEAIYSLEFYETGKVNIEVINLDYDAGDYASHGGDYINFLGWLEETGRNYPIHIHSMNPVGIENMRRIIRKNGWKET